MILVPAVDACSPLLFLRVRGVGELQSCPPSPEEIKLGNFLSFPPPILHCVLSKEMNWADLSRAVPALGPVPSVPISRALAGREGWSQTDTLTILISLVSPPNWKRMRGLSDLSAALLEASLHICDLDKFLGHIRFVLGLGVIPSKLHNGRQFKQHTSGRQSGKSVFPWSRHVFLELGCHSHTPFLSLLRVQSVLILEELQRCLLLLWKLGLHNKYAFPNKLPVCQLLPGFHAVFGENSREIAKQMKQILMKASQPAQMLQMLAWSSGHTFSYGCVRIFLSKTPHFFESSIDFPTRSKSD